jgi:membrane-bound inhibitor of C-type lysozyme
MASRKLTSSIAATVAVIAIGAGSYGIAAATSSSASATASTSPASTSTSTSPASTSPAGSSAAPGGGESNARSGPAAGGTTGTVSGVSNSGFTVKTATGQKATIKETSATTYQRGTSPASAGAITAGESVLVVGTTDSTTITATQVTVQPAGSGTEPSSAAQVVPFSRGTTSTSKQVGQIPADYQQGSGTIVSGTAANKATKAALAAYPGGIVDRVVQLANGQYEVHYIGVNWHQHIFVNQDFQVIGAD